MTAPDPAAANTRITRLAEVRPSTGQELAATLVLAMPIERWSLKVSSGWPEDGADDVAGPAWAGVLPVTTRVGEPVPAPDLRPGIATAASAVALATAPEPPGSP